MDDDDETIPSKEECERRIDEFVRISEKDSALAMAYLQNRNWDLQKAVVAYFNSEDPFHPGTFQERDDDHDDHEPVEDKPAQAQAPAGPPKRFRLITWNIDGLSKDSLPERTKAACIIINKEEADVVFLQEVVPETHEIIQTMCPAYHIVNGGTSEYFTLMLLKAGEFELESHEIVPFTDSKMGRNLLIARVTHAGKPVVLMTSHLESTKEFEKERRKQLKICFDRMALEGERKTVIFGGDLNLRDIDVHEVGDVPTNIEDLWESLGKRKEAAYTWDTYRNTNLNLSFKTRLRFDRVYFRYSKLDRCIQPKYMELVGLEKIPSCGRFPSDHWGILVHFDQVL